MDSLDALKTKALAAGSEQRVFDWDKAARLIVESGAKEAGAGLSSDWGWTGGSILVDGKPDLESYTFLSSNWATPELEIDGDVVECWRYESATPGWDASTKWPESALAILAAGRGQSSAGPKP